VHLPYVETPTFEIRTPSTEKAGVRLLVKREDLNHPEISGNKWWKLLYNVQTAKENGFSALLTFGGAYSNHIYATASAAHISGLKAIGIIRGEEVLPLNPTLAFAKAMDMKLEFVSRENYKRKNEAAFVNELSIKYGPFYLIPEGGTNMMALRGCEEFAKKELNPIVFDTLILPVGTGGTIAGIACGLDKSRTIVGVSVLKNGVFLEEQVTELIHQYSGARYGNWSILTSYDHGGYAKVTKELLAFVNAMKSEHNLPLDHVYTGKLLYATMKEIELGNFKRGTTILALHTGGLQRSQNQL
jgi:1-aminocyclopropane-1-carboxylate deaminase